MAGSRVVVGVDGSPLSVSAVSHAARIASARGLDLVVLHAFAADLPMLGFGGGADRREVDAHATRLLAEGTALVDASRTAALVVVGARGHGVLSRAGVGAVAMQVVTHARCPVLVVGHESAPAGGGRVVVGVDGSKASLKALGVAFDEAALTGASLDVVHAWQPRGAGDPTLSASSSWSGYEAELEASVDRALGTRRTTHPDVKVEHEVVDGDPSKALVDRSEGAALLVVGSRGSGGFDGLHVGSTALQLMGRSQAPILVVR
jgi:nucleotide-binding universal stress UspA family protein